ncbi:MAG: ATP phosphoribosyltransferase regulatory subunit [Eubacteriales bacterium]|nr:ATP phosphoribosyltransferase regulatory subunit [Eubacteriales bacterium]
MRFLEYQEKIILKLRSLYRQYGYLPYRMSKFEEYELYSRYKEFMVSDRVVAFSDTNGKLMALKPDVTLSIIKSGSDVPGVKQKVCYNENVYRVSPSTHRFKEIMQAGLECIGDVDLYDVYEVVCLAAQSLAAVSERFVLCLSHLGVLNSAVGRLGLTEEQEREALALLSAKNTHDLRRLCEGSGTDRAACDTLCALAGAYGRRADVLAALRGLPGLAGMEELEKLSALLDGQPFDDRILFDFSLSGDIHYYNGFVFKGYLEGVTGDVLSGGQYDNLMRKMGRRSGAIGFAVYLDMLEQLAPRPRSGDVEYLVLYDETVPTEAVAAQMARLTAEGHTVSAQKSVPGKLRYRKVLDLRKGGSSC